MYGMYMTRITTAGYGTWLFHLAIVNLLLTLALTAIFHSYNYLVIFLFSGVMLSLLEYVMVKKGARTSKMMVYGRLVSPLVDSLIKGTAEGPGLCVPALFAADQMVMGHFAIGILGPCVMLLLWSLYWAASEKNGFKKLAAGQSPTINRRWMNKPEPIFVIGVVDLIVAISIFNMNPENVRHVVYFMVMFFVILQVFFLVHSSYGVRRIDKYDPETKTFAPSTRRYSIIGYTFDSIFEMVLLNTPYYLIPYALGMIVIPKM